MTGTSFAVTGTAPHDLLIEDNEITMVSGDSLFVQRLQAVWSTNKGEWSLDKQEGIDRYVILTKNYDEDSIREELEAALLLLNPDARIEEFSLEVDKQRHAVIRLSVQIGSELYPITLE